MKICISGLFCLEAKLKLKVLNVMYIHVTKQRGRKIVAYIYVVIMWAGGVGITTSTKNNQLSDYSLSESKR